MKTKANTKYGIFIAFILIALLSFQLYINRKPTNAEDINIMVFKEDKKPNISLPGYILSETSIWNDIDPKSSENIFVTYSFLLNKDIAKKVKNYIDNGYKVLVQGNVDEEKTFKILNLPIVVSSVDVGPTRLVHGGCLIVKDIKDGKYYTNQVNFENPDNESNFYKVLFDTFKIDKDILKGNFH